MNIWINQQMSVTLGRFQLPTYRVEAGYSLQLNYRAKVLKKVIMG